MKLICPLLLLAVGTALWADEPSATNRLAATHITSDSVEFDMEARVATYTGNVRVADPSITMTCEYLTARVPASGRVESIIAETNVVAVIVTNNTTFTITAARATYLYQVFPFATNQTLELAGVPAPKITWPQEDSDPVQTNEFSARRIIWDLHKNTLKADEHRGVFPDMESMRKRVALPKDAPASNAVTEPKPATP
jgi:lipopolysaccharide export system protein LptA